MSTANSSTTPSNSNTKENPSQLNKRGKKKKKVKRKEGFVFPISSIDFSYERPTTSAQKEGFISSTDGVKLYWRRYEVEKATPKGTIVIIHGFGEHSGLWEHVGIVLLRAQYDVVMYDQRGYGQSEGKRGHMPSLAQSIRDTDVILRYIVRSEPTFLYGHSSGGNIALQYCIAYCEQHVEACLESPAVSEDSNVTPNIENRDQQQQPRAVGGVIASAPYLRLTVDIPRWQKRVIKFISKTYKSYTIFAEMEPGKLTHDVEMQQLYTSDPMVIPNISAKQLVELDNAARHSLKNAHKLNLPLLVLHGSDDAVTDYKASEEFVNKAGSRDKDFNLVWGFFHDLHMEKNRRRVFKKIITWCSERCCSAIQAESNTSDPLQNVYQKDEPNSIPHEEVNDNSTPTNESQLNNDVDHNNSTNKTKNESSQVEITTSENSKLNSDTTNNEEVSSKESQEQNVSDHQLEGNNNSSKKQGEQNLLETSSSNSYLLSSNKNTNEENESDNAKSNTNQSDYYKTNKIKQNHDAEKHDNSSFETSGESIQSKNENQENDQPNKVEQNNQQPENQTNNTQAESSNTFQQEEISQQDKTEQKSNTPNDFGESTINSQTINDQQISNNNDNDITPSIDQEISKEENYHQSEDQENQTHVEDYEKNHENQIDEHIEQYNQSSQQENLDLKK